MCVFVLAVVADAVYSIAIIPMFAPYKPHSMRCVLAMKMLARPKAANIVRDMSIANIGIVFS